MVVTESREVSQGLIEHNIHTFILHTTSGLPYISWLISILKLS